MKRDRKMKHGDGKLEWSNHIKINPPNLKEKKNRRREFGTALLIIKEVNGSNAR